jgi:asparagine synthase (glutamine-hydrolysing)
MCGIAGIVRLGPGAPVDTACLDAMTGPLLHRGPDDRGLWSDENCGLAARRLSIVDLNGGHQPIISQDGTTVVVQNGEIYNYPALRQTLEAQGFRFRTTCDTEVILHAYRAWGTGAAQHLHGMFALAVWDAQAQRAWLARDRFGIKPLYYALHDGALLFASEIKALLAYPGLPRRLNQSALTDLLTVGFVPGPQTIFQGIHKLPPVHYLCIDSAAGTWSQHAYWQLPAAPTIQAPRTTAQAVDQLRTLLTAAVERHLQSDVPVGALLSGGLDSTGLVALMRQRHPEAVHTFSIGFDVPGAPQYDEQMYAALGAQHLATQHHPITFTLADFDHLPRAVWHLEQPLASATFLPLFRLYEACHAAGLKVILTGEGADELFAGYGWYRGDRLVRRLQPLPLAARRLLTRLPMSAGAQRALLTAGNAAARYVAWQRIGDRPPAALLTAGIPGRNLAEEWAADWPGASALSQLQVIESRSRLPDFINAEVDAMSMAHSVEARVPYLDTHLWETVMSWPDLWRARAGQPEKWLLRRVYAPLLPPAIAQRRKQGLASPHARWWQQPRLPDWAEEAISPQSLAATGWFRPEVVHSYRQLHQSGKSNLAPYLTAVLTTQLWQAAFRV